MIHATIPVVRSVLAMLLVLAVALVLLLPGQAHAYIGPGAGFALRFLQVGNLQAYAFLFGAGVVLLLYFILFGTK